MDNWGYFKLHAKSAHLCTFLYPSPGARGWDFLPDSMWVIGCCVSCSCELTGGKQCLLSHSSSYQEVWSNLVKWFCFRDSRVFAIKMLVQSHLKAWRGQVLAGSCPWQEASSVLWVIHGRSSCWVSWAGVVQPEATVALVTAASLLGCLLSPSASLSLCAAHFYF